MTIIVTSADTDFQKKLEGADVETESKNAELVLNGKLVTRSSNTINDMITGVTLELRSLRIEGPLDSPQTTRRATKPNLSPSPKTLQT